MKLGLIVNPVAGIGGRVGLKGSDGSDTVSRALELGAKPTSPRRAVETLAAFADLRPRIELLTYPSEMGEQEAREAGFDPVVVGCVTPGHTTAEDTRRAARDFVEQ